MTSRYRSIIGAVLILISTLCVGFILSSSTEGLGWVDLTQNKRYTLTDGTQSIIEKMRRPLKVKLFYSDTAVKSIGTDQLAQFVRAYYYARDLLRAYERASGGKLEFQELDPINYSDEAEEAVELGIRIVPLTENHNFAFGIAVTSDTGAKEVLPFVDAREEGLLEYKITKLIERASKKEKKKVGVVTALSLVGEDLSPEMQRLRQFQGRPTQKSWNIIQWLRTDYEVETIDATAKTIPADIDYLLVIHPKKFTDPILYAIDQYVMRGGKLIAFVDPHCNSDQPAGPQQNPYAQFSHERSSDLNRLTKSWGVTMDATKIIGDRALAGMDRGAQLLPYLVLTQANESFNKEEAITQSLDEGARVVMFGAGNLVKAASADTEISPLIQTTKDGGVRKYLNADMIQAQSKPNSLWDPKSADNPDGFEAAGTRLAAAVRISGKFKSAFPDGLPKGSNGDTETPDEKPDEEKDKPEHLKECKEPNTVILFGDVDLLSDNFTYPPTSFFGSPLSNKAVVYNALDYLSGSSDLINIRSRGSARREFDYIVDIRKEAATKTADKEAAIQKEIEAYQKELNALNDEATQKNVGVLRGAALKKERETRLKIEKKKKELNDVKRDSSVSVQRVQAWAKAIDTFGMPGLVALIGLILWIVGLVKRSKKMREDMA